MGKEMSKSTDDMRDSSASTENFSTEEDINVILDSMGKKKFGMKGIDILKIASYLTSSLIEKSIFSTLLNNEQELRDALKLLEKLSLIDLFWETGVFSVKENVAERVRSYLAEKKLEESAIKIALKFTSESPESKDMAIHIVSVLSYAKKYPELFEENSSVLVSVLNSLKLSKDYSEAYLLGSKTYEAAKESLGEYHKTTLEFQKEAAELSFLCLKFEKAMEIAIDLYEKESNIVGHKKCSPTLKMIAKYKLEVEKKPESESEVRKLVFGDVPVAETKNNTVLGVWDTYAVLLVNCDLDNEALEVLQEVLKRRCELLSPDDDDIDEVNISIAAVYFKKNEYTKGVDLLEGVCERRNTRFGEFSLKTISVRDLLGQGYIKKEMHDRALEVLKDVADKLRQVTGKSSMYYNALTHLGKLYFILNNFEKSYDVNSELYEMRKAEYGEEDDVAFAFQQNMMSCLIPQRKVKEAAEFHQRVLTGLLKKYGLLNSKTLKWCNILEGEGLTYTHCNI